MRDEVPINNPAPVASTGETSTPIETKNTIIRTSGLNHITFSVSHLNRAVTFYQNVFGAELLFLDERTAYLAVGSLWMTLNVQTDIPRQEIRFSYTHLAFTIESTDLIPMEQRLRRLGVELRPARARHAGEGESLYFADPDGHLLEFHTGDLKTRLQAYEPDTASDNNV